MAIIRNWTGEAAFVKDEVVVSGNPQTQFRARKNISALAEVAADSFNLSGKRATGLAIYGDNLYIADNNPAEILIYDKTTKAVNDGATAIQLDDANTNPHGLCVSGDILYVANITDSKASKIFAYDVRNGSRRANDDFELDDENTRPFGIWTDGETMWVSDDVARKIFAYNVTNKLRDTANEKEVSGRPGYLFSRDGDLWVSDLDDDKYYAYRLYDMAREESKDYYPNEIGGTNFAIGGIVVEENDTYTISRNDENSRVVAYRGGNDAPVGGDGDANWQSVSSSGGGGSPTDLVGVDYTGNTLRFTQRDGDTEDFTVPAINANTNPYQFFSQIKDIAAPAVTSGTISATGEGLVLPFVAKYTPTDVAIAGRNFETSPEGFININLAVSRWLRVVVETTHHFSEVDSDIPDLVTGSRERQFESVIGHNAIALSEFVSNVVITPQSTGGALAGQRIPISMRILLTAYNAVGDMRESVGYTNLTYNKVGITFKQLANNSGAKGDKGETGAAGAAGQNGEQGPRGAQGATGPQGPAGAPGSDGQDGVPGDAATLQISGVDTLTAGQPATVTEQDGSNAQARNYHLGIPRGAQGEQGDTGPQGDTGAAGTAATIAVGNVTTGAAGSSATITNSGTSSAAVFEFTIPRGDRGEQGNPGAQGPQGDTGLQGPKGDTGDAGEDGATHGRSVLYNTQTNITSAGNTQTFNAGNLLTLTSGTDFSGDGIILFEFGFNAGGLSQTTSLTVDAETFRGSTATAPMIIRGSDQTASGYTWGVWWISNTQFRVAMVGGSGYIRRVIKHTWS